MKPIKTGKHGGNHYFNGPVTEEEKNVMAKLWNDGRSAGEIAAKTKKRSRNAVIGIITRMRDRGDPRIVRGSLKHAQHWTDAESLKLLALVETDGLSFTHIGRLINRPGGACKKHYEDILNDMAAAGML